MTAARALFASRPALRRYWLAGLVSQLGDWLSYVAISLMALERGSGAVAVAIVLVAHSLPHALLAPLGGVLADRFDRARLMAIVRLLQGVTTLGLLFAATSDHLGGVFALLLVRTSLGALVTPAQQALLPLLAGPGGVLLANKVLSSTWSLMFTAGMILGGVLADLGPTLALALDTGTFLVAAGLLATLPPSHSESAPPGRTRFLDVLTPLQAHPRLLRAVLGKAPLAVASGGGWVLLNLEAEALAATVGTGLGLGLLQALRGTGTAIGPLLAGRGEGSGGERRGALPLLELTAFAGIAGVALATGPAGLGLAVVVWGLGTGGNWVITNAAQHRLAPDAVLGRASALDFAVSTTLSCAGALGGGALADVTGVPVLAAWGPLALGMVLWVSLWGLTCHPQLRLGASNTAL